MVVVKTDKLSFQLQNLSFTTDQKHSNIMQWTGGVSFVDKVSDGVPGGAEFPTLLERQGVETAITTMIDMPLNCQFPDDWFNNPAEAFTAHNVRFVIGHVKKCWIEGNSIMCSGIIYKDNFPDVAFMIQNAKEALGFSIECYILSKEILDEIEHIKALEFIGLTICWSSLAAFEDTFITKLAATRKRKVVDNMTEEQMKEILGTFTKEIGEKISAVEQNVAELKTKIDEVDTLKDTVEKMTATKEDIPAPTATQTSQQVVPKDTMNFTQEFEKINASKEMSPEEKLNARFKILLQQKQ